MTASGESRIDEVTAPPVLQAFGISLVPIALIMLATELPGLQKGLLTTSLTGREWLACFGLAAVLPIVIESGKWIRRRRTPTPPAPEVQQAVAPARAATDVEGGM